MLTDIQGLLTTGGTATAGPIGTVAGTIVGGFLGGIGSKYTKATFVERFVGAANSGDDATAGALVDQAVYHGWIQGVSDAGTWQGLLAACYDRAPTKWRTYIELRLSGAPAQYDFIGTTVPSPVSLKGVAPTTAPAKTIGEVVLDWFGVGPTAQQQLAQQAGASAGHEVARAIVLVVVVVAVGFVLFKLLRR